MQNKTKYLLLLGIVVVALFFNSYKKDSSPPGFNADEAAFGYNAYSILKTGRDEYGNLLPLRLKSFGENKMPLYSYLSVPIILTFGLTEDATRLLNTSVAIFLPIIIFLLSKKIFEDEKIGMLSALLVASSLGLNIAGRHTHEAYLAILFVSISLFFFINLIKKQNLQNTFFFSGAFLLALFSAQSSRIFILFFVVVAGFLTMRGEFKKIFLIVLIAVFSLFLLTDVVYKPERVKNLFFANNIGFGLTINELRAEGAPRILYNKLTLGARDTILQQFKYYSPDFLAINGDANYRFGFPKMSPVTIVEYLMALTGIYFLFRKKNKWRFFLMLLLIVAPLSASLSYGEASLTRALFLLIPVLMLGSYGFINTVSELRNHKLELAFISLVVLAEVAFLFYSWDFYLNHYPKRAVVIRSWQAGYKQLGEYLVANYPKYKNFYVTKQNGEPYVYALFYLKYSPAAYQKQAKLSAPDEYGFGQIEGFDKFNFNFQNPASIPNGSSLIGSPEDFSQLSFDKTKIKKIIAGGQEMFWIYEKP